MIPGHRPIVDEKGRVISAIAEQQNRRMFRLGWPILDEIATTAPTRDTLPPGMAQVYDDGTNHRIYFNDRNTIYYWGLTAA